MNLTVVGIENPTFAASTGKAFNSAEKVSSHSQGGHPDELLVEADLLRADLEPNCVVRKWSEPRDARANLRVQVPGGHLATAEGTRLDFQMISSATKLTPTTTLTNLNTAYQSLVEITREPTRTVALSFLLLRKDEGARLCDNLSRLSL